MADQAVTREQDRESMTRRAIVGLLARTLRPLALLMLRQGMTAYEFDEVARWVFAQAAMDQEAFAIRNRNVWRMTKSRAAVLTGFTRREIDRLVSMAEPAVEGARENFHRLDRVLAAWQTRAGYQDENGRPRDLAVKGDCSFDALARQCGRDIPVRALLDEAVERGCVERPDRDTVHFVHARTGGASIPLEELDELGRQAGHFMTLIERRLGGRATPGVFTETSAGPLSPEHHAMLVEHVDESVQAFMARIRQQLSSHPKSLVAGDADQMVLGIYNGFI